MHYQNNNDKGLHVVWNHMLLDRCYCFPATSHCPDECWQ